MIKIGARHLLAVLGALAVAQGCRCSGSRSDAEPAPTEAPTVPPARTPAPAAPKVQPVRAAEIDNVERGASKSGQDDKLARSEEWARIAATWQEARALLAQRPTSFNTRDLMSALTRLNDALTDVGTLADKGLLPADDAALLRLGLKVIGEAEHDLPVGTESDPPTPEQIVAQLSELVPDLQRLASKTGLRPEISRQVGVLLNMRVAEAQRLMAGRAAANDKSLTELVDTVRTLSTQLSRPSAGPGDAAANSAP